MVASMQRAGLEHANCSGPFSRQQGVNPHDVYLLAVGRFYNLISNNFVSFSLKIP